MIVNDIILPNHLKSCRIFNERCSKGQEKLARYLTHNFVSVILLFLHIHTK